MLVIDRDEPVTSSKIAAGLITPITGQRLTKSWRWDELWPAAVDLYRRVEFETGAKCFHRRRMLRLFANLREQNVFAKRLAEPGFPSLVRQPQPLVNAAWFDGELGGFEMPDAGQLDVARYLAESRASFASAGSYRTAEVDQNRDIHFDSDHVTLPRLDVQARCLIFCQGFAATRNRWFDRVPFDATKGEILTIRVPGLRERRVVHRGLWLAPVNPASDDSDVDSCEADSSVRHDSLYRAGSTYDWNELDSKPTASGRDAICSRLEQFLRLPFEVVEHQAAVRPIVVGRHPVVGLHPENTRIGFFNGLASKGSLQAPFFASQFAAFLSDNGDLDRDVDLAHRVDWQGGLTANRSENTSSITECPVPSPLESTETETSEPVNRRLTEVAHQVVSEVVRPGEVVIDATAGNGHDTLFLAQLVGPQGTVFALDVQPQAIARTGDRLKDAGYTNVELVQHDHAQLQSTIRERSQDQIAAVMFNLGYLPGGDKSVMTQLLSTLPAIDAAIALIRPGGVLTVIAYPGHPGGAEEAAAVESRLGRLPDDQFDVRRFESHTSSNAAPILFAVIRRLVDV